MFTSETVFFIAVDRGLCLRFTLIFRASIGQNIFVQQLRQVDIFLANKNIKKTISKKYAVI